MPLSPSSTGNKVPCSKCPCAAKGGGAGKGVGASCGAGKDTLPLSKGNKGVSPASALLIAAAAAYTGFAYGKNLYSNKTSAGGSGSRTAGSKPKAAAAAANGKAPAAKPAPLPPVTDFEKSLMPWTQLATATGGAGGVCARRAEITNKLMTEDGCAFVANLPASLTKACGGQSTEEWRGEVMRAVGFALRAVASVLAGEDVRKVAAAWRKAESEELHAAAAGAGAAALRGWRNWVDTDTVAVKGAIEKLLLAKP
ncbi:hypothetical protein RI054_20g90060 [Pseudoscourfieldia marina]